MSTVHALSRPRLSKRIYIGMKFNMLTVLGRDAMVPAMVYAKCECGKIIKIRSAVLGKNTSCGCYKKKLMSAMASRHGMTGTREMRSYQCCLARCYRESNHNYMLYGGRGIGMCQRWRDSFLNFYADMGPCPPGHSLDRINVNGGYEPGNCKWSSPVEQSNNKRNNTIVIYGGKKYTIANLARALGLSYGSTVYRVGLSDKAMDLIDQPKFCNLR